MLKKVILIFNFICLSISFSNAQSSYTFESLSISDQATTYIVVLEIDANGSATITRTTRTSVTGDLPVGGIALPFADFSSTRSTSSIELNIIDPNNLYIYFIDDNSVGSIANGEGATTVTYSCLGPCEGSGDCELVSRITGSGSQAYACSCCDIIKIVNKVITPNNGDGSGWAVFRATSIN